MWAGSALTETADVVNAARGMPFFLAGYNRARMRDLAVWHAPHGRVAIVPPVPRHAPARAPIRAIPARSIRQCST